MLSRVLFLPLLLLTGIVTARAAQVPTFYAREEITPYACEQPQGLLVIVDTNGDGIPDIVCNTMLLGNGDGTFRAGAQINFPNGLGETVALDTNGDGKVDLIYPAYTNNQFALAVGLGNGDGTFQSPVYYYSGVNDDTTDDGAVPLAIGDFNGDGIADVAMLGSHEIVLFAGSSAGPFVATVIEIQNQSPFNLSTGLAAADMNADGRLDLVVNANSEILVLLGNGNGTFQTQITTKIPERAGDGAMAVGDLNGDGFPDVALLSYENSSVSLYEGNGNGRFRAATTVDLVGSGSQALAIADLNGDGIPDLVTDLVEIAFGEGHGKFAPPVYYATDGEGLFDGAGALGIADLRGNGRLDLVGDGAYFVQILLNAGKGVYEEGILTTVPGGYIACSAPGDFNGDGIPDLAISNSSALLIYLGTGKAGAPFSAGATYTVVNAGCPLVGDLNGDGKSDVLVPSNTSVIAYLGKGDGTFTQGPTSALPTPASTALGDFNGDGKLDYATSSNLLALGNGDGSFGNPVPYVTNLPSNGLYQIATADLNGDGRTDIVLSASFNGALYVLLANKTGGFDQTIVAVEGGGPQSLFIGDLNGDGKPDVAFSYDLGVGVFLNNGKGGLGTFIEFLTPSFGGFPVIADVNGDGIADLVTQGPATAIVFVGEGANKFAAPIYFGTGGSSTGLFTLNTHGQSPRRGLPDLVEVDSSGMIYDLINTTKK